MDLPVFTKAAQGMRRTDPSRSVPSQVVKLGILRLTNVSE